MGRESEYTFLQRRHTDGHQAHAKGAQHHSSLGKCKSKSQWNITSHLSEWLLSKRHQNTSVGEDVEKRELLCTVGENVDRCSHYGKQYGDSSKN